MKEPFLFHSSLPGLLVSSHFFFFSFISSFLVTWWSFLWFWFHEIFCQHSAVILWELFPHADVFLRYLWEEVSSKSFYSTILIQPPSTLFLFCFFWMEVTKQQQYIKSIWSNVPFKASFLNDFLSGWSARWCKWDVKSSLLLLCYCQFFPLGLLIFVGYILGALLLGHIYL